MAVNLGSTICNSAPDGDGLPDMLSGYGIFSSQDLFEVREHIAQTYCPHQLSLARSSEKLDAWLNHKRLNKVGIGVMAYGADVEIEGIEDQDMLLLMQPLSGEAEIGISNGFVDSDHAVASVVDTGDLKRMRWTGNCVQRVVQISNEVLEHHATLLMGRTLSQKLRFAPEMAMNGREPNWWLYASLLSMELAAPDKSNRRAVLDSLETLLILKLLECQPSNYSEQFQPQACRIAPHHVRKVEQFIIAHADQPITLEQLVTVANVSARALFDGFRRFRGTSPMAYLKSVRMERAYEDLQKGGRGDTVTDIACRWGFFQFGRFAAEYKRIYGQLPSETLRSTAFN